MARHSAAAMDLIGRDIVRLQPRRWGRIIAVIHRATGVDILVERRRWLLPPRTHRIAVDDVIETSDGRLVVGLPAITPALGRIGSGPYENATPARR